MKKIACIVFMIMFIFNISIVSHADLLPGSSAQQVDELKPQKPSVETAEQSDQSSIMEPEESMLALKPKDNNYKSLTTGSYIKFHHLDVILQSMEYFHTMEINNTEIKPNNPDSILLDLVLRVKNAIPVNLRMLEAFISITVYSANGEIYTTDYIVEDMGEEDDSKETKTVHFYCEVPEAVSQQAYPFQIILKNDEGAYEWLYSSISYSLKEETPLNTSSQIQTEPKSDLLDDTLLASFSFIEYSLEEIEAVISIPEEYKVYTRDGQGDEEFLKQFLWSKDIVLENMISNNTYLMCISEDGKKQITVVAQETTGDDTIIDLDDNALISEFSGIFSKMYEQMGGTILENEIYKTHNYTFLKLYITVPQNGMDTYVIQYIFIGDEWTYIIQSASLINEFTEEDKDMLSQVVDSFMVTSDLTKDDVQTDSVSMEQGIDGTYVSLVDGEEFNFHSDGTLLHDGLTGRYIIKNNEITIIINGLANKYTYEFLDGLLILYDSSGQGIAYSKIEKQDSTYQDDTSEIIAQGSLIDDNTIILEDIVSM